MIAMRFAALCGTPRIAGVDRLFLNGQQTPRSRKNVSESRFVCMAFESTFAYGWCMRRIERLCQSTEVKNGCCDSGMK
jgi:hypothetical protein